MKNKPTIRRSKHQTKYSTFGNELLQSEKISYEALGLLLNLLSRPPNWTVILTTLHREGCGKDKLSRMVNELIALGYIHRSQGRVGKGRYGAVEYTISEEKIKQLPLPLEADEPEADEPEAVKPEADEPEAVKPEADEPEAVKPPLQTTDSTKTETEQITDSTKTTTTKELLMLFPIFCKRDLDNFVKELGIDRVEFVCTHAIFNPKIRKLNDWTFRALTEEYDLPALACPFNENENPDEHYTYTQKMKEGLSPIEAYQYTKENNNTLGKYADYINT